MDLFAKLDFPPGVCAKTVHWQFALQLLHAMLKRKLLADVRSFGDVGGAQVDVAKETLLFGLKPLMSDGGVQGHPC